MEVQNGVDSDVRAQTKGKSGRRARNISVRGVVSNHGSQSLMIGGVKIRGVMDSAAKLDGSKGFVSSNEMNSATRSGALAVQTSVTNDKRADNQY